MHLHRKRLKRTLRAFLIHTHIHFLGENLRSRKKPLRVIGYASTAERKKSTMETYTLMPPWRVSSHQFAHPSSSITQKLSVPLAIFVAFSAFQLWAK